MEPKPKYDAGVASLMVTATDPLGNSVLPTTKL
jgi:hypothetical protein